MNNEVQVKIVGDATSAVAASNLAKDAISESASLMRGKLAEASESVRASMAGIAESAKAGAAGVQGAASVVSVASEKIQAAGERAKAGWEGLGSAMGRMNAVFAGVAAAMMGGEVFKESVGATTKLTAATLKLSKSLGITLEQASGLHAAMNKFGISTDTVADASQKMSRQLKHNETGINALGVKTRDSSGNFLDMQAILMNGTEVLRGYKEGADRTIASQILFGRGAGDTAALLKLTNEQLVEGAEVAKRLGLVITQDGVDAYKKFQVAQNEMRETMEAVQVAIGNAVLPTLIEFGGWLRNNGAAAVEGFKRALSGFGDVMRLIGTVAKGLYDVAASVFSAIGDVVTSVFGAQASREFLNFDNWMKAVSATVTTFKLVAVSAFAVIGGAIAALIEDLKMFGKIAYDVFTLNWGSIAGDWSTGINKIASIAIGAANKIKAAYQDADAAIKGLNSPTGSQPPAHDTSMDGAPTGTKTFGEGAFDKAKKPKKPPKEKAPESCVGQWENELGQRKLALDRQNNTENTFREMSKSEEAAYWQAILQRAGLSTKERHDVEAKYLAASLAAKKDAFHAHIAQEQELTSAKNNGGARLVIAQNIEREIGRAYGENSKEAAQAKQARIRAEQDVAAEIVRIAEEAAQRRERIDLEVVDAEEQLAKHRVEMGQETNGQLIQQQLQFENRRAQIRKTALDAEIAALGHDPNASPEAKRKLDQQLEQLEAKHQATIAGLRQKAELEATHRTRAGIGSVASSWSQALAKMATLQASFSDTIKSLWQGLASAISNALAGIIEKYITQWLTTLVIGKAAGSAKNVAEVMSLAAVAGAAAFASTAAIPIIGPALAPAAAAASYAGASAFAPLASFATGAWELPRDMVAQLHAGEMVVPKTFAEDFRANGVMGSATPRTDTRSDAGPGRPGGQTIEVHIHAIDTRSGAEFLMKHKSAVAQAVSKAVRNGFQQG